MTLSASLRTPELLEPYFRLELEQLVAGLQVQFNRNLPAPIHFVNGAIVPLTLSLRTPELLQPPEREELERLVSAFQAAFNDSSPTSVVKSTYRGTVAVAGSASSGTALVPAVNMANAVLTWNGNTGAGFGSTNSESLYRLMLVNATTVQADRHAATSASAGTVGFTLTEYQPGVLKSVQYRTVANLAALSFTDTIAAVDPNKTVIYPLGQSVLDVSAWTAGVPARYALTNATTVTITVENAYTSTLSYVVVEFN